MNILLTNDDGIDAPGLKALVESVPPGMQVVVAAPASERSASSHSISLGQKLRIEKFEKRGVRQFSVHGTPADCVKFALVGIPDFVPDLIISGINQGANTGVSVYYSGTISAAREGFINGIPSVALSLASRMFNDFSACMGIARNIMQGYAAGRFPKNVMLNINVPPLAAGEILGVRITKQASSRFIEEFIPEKEHGDKKVYTLAGEIEVLNADGTSDEEAVLEGFISITPLKLDLTEYEALSFLKTWAEESRLCPGDSKTSKRIKETRHD